MSEPQQEAKKDGDASQFRNGVIAFVVVLALITIGLALLAWALASSAETAAASVVVVRDLVIIVMAAEFIVIATAVTVLIIQIARLVNLLTNEVRPLIDTATDTVKSVRGTAEFVSRHVTDPVIKTAGALGGLSKMLSDVEVLRKAAGFIMQAVVTSTPTSARSSAPNPPQYPETDLPISGTISTDGGSDGSATIKDNF